MLNAISCAVIVVPILAPSIMLIACLRDISPALTNPMTITVVALLLWSTAVHSAPARTPSTGFLVSSARIFFILSPADFWRPSLIRFIPYMNRASPPSIVIIICTVSEFISYLLLQILIQNLLIGFYSQMIYVISDV